MRNVVLGALACAGMVAAAMGWIGAQDAAYAQRSARDLPTGGELITFTSPVDERHEQLTVIDPRMRVVGVYHVERESGQIALKSVRNIHWDLQMVEFNSVSPLPREIRSLLEQN